MRREKSGSRDRFPFPLGPEPMTDLPKSDLEKQAIATLKQARAMARGPKRNELRQIARILRALARLASPKAWPRSPEP